MNTKFMIGILISGIWGAFGLTDDMFSYQWWFQIVYFNSMWIVAPLVMD